MMITEAHAHTHSRACLGSGLGGLFPVITLIQANARKWNIRNQLHVALHISTELKLNIHTDRRTAQSCDRLTGF